VALLKLTQVVMQPHQRDDTVLGKSEREVERASADAMIWLALTRPQPPVQ
jgi:hypothetical protein